MKFGGIRIPLHGFPGPRLGHMFWQLYPEPVIGVHVCMLSPTDTDVCTENILEWFSAPTSLNDDLLNDGVILEHVMKQSTWFSKVPLFCTLEDDYGKSLFHEVNTCNVRRYDRTGVATQR